MTATPRLTERFIVHPETYAELVELGVVADERPRQLQARNFAAAVLRPALDWARAHPRSKRSGKAEPSP